MRNPSPTRWVCRSGGFELAVGFLFTEGILDRHDQVREIVFCGPVAAGRSTSNIVRVEPVTAAASAS